MTIAIGTRSPDFSGFQSNRSNGALESPSRGGVDSARFGNTVEVATPINGRAAPEGPPAGGRGVAPRQGEAAGHGRGQALLAPAILGVAQQAQEEASSEPASPNDAELTDEEEQVVAKLKQTDAETERHEQAHAAAGGQYAGSPSYSYQTGPDGKQYAIGGEVSIDVSPIDGDPDAMIRMMQ